LLKAILDRENLLFQGRRIEKLPLGVKEKGGTIFVAFSILIPALVERVRKGRDGVTPLTL
jgi:hypothetical protein